MADNEQARRSALVCAYFLSRLDRKGIALLGYETATQAMREIGNIIGENPNNIKNMREEFDPQFPNPRVGWYQRPMRPSRQVVFDELAQYTDEELLAYVRQILFASPEGEAVHEQTDGWEKYDETTRVAETLIRRGQAKFHEMVLAAYHQRCCMTGLAVPDLLQAAHIKSWESADPVERRDPCNGLCLNPLHHLAFDRGYLTVDRNRQIRVATEFRRRARTDGDRLVADCEGRSIILPDRYLPSPEFLEWHQDTVFLG